MLGLPSLALAPGRSPAENRVHTRGDLRLAPLQHVPIRVRGQRDRLWPSRFLTSSRVKPWASRNVAAAWRRSWNRLCGSPARTRARWKARVTAAASIGRADRGGEHVARLHPTRASEKTLLALSGPVGTEGRHDHFRQRDGPAAPLGLGLQDHQACCSRARGCHAPGGAGPRGRRPPIAAPAVLPAGARCRARSHTAPTGDRRRSPRGRRVPARG